MNIKDLKEMIDKYPDDTVIYYGEGVDGLNEVTRILFKEEVHEDQKEDPNVRSIALY